MPWVKPSKGPGESNVIFTRNGLKYIFQLNLQIHFVSMNTRYSSLGDSLGHSDGLAVLGVFLKVTHVCLFIKLNPSTPRFLFKGRRVVMFLFTSFCLWISDVLWARPIIKWNLQAVLSHDMIYFVRCSSFWDRWPLFSRNRTILMSFSTL